jgi:hypothetical protein
MPNWLTRRRGDDDMANYEPVNPPPPVATLPIPNTTPTNGAHGELTLQEAFSLAERYEAEKAKWMKLSEDALQRIKDLDRKNKFMELELVKAQNDVQTLQATVYELQQKNSDLRAMQSELHALAKHMVTRYEQEEIPLPVRKRATKGNSGVEKKPIQPAEPLPVDAAK